MPETLLQLTAIALALAFGGCAEQSRYVTRGNDWTAAPDRTSHKAAPSVSAGLGSNGAEDEPEPIVVSTPAPSAEATDVHAASLAVAPIDTVDQEAAPATDTNGYDPPAVDAWLRESELPIYIGQAHQAATKACRAAGGRTLPIRKGSTGCIVVRFPIYDPSGVFGDAPVLHRLQWSQSKGKVAALLLDVDFSDVNLKQSDRVRAMMMSLEDVYVSSLTATYGMPDFGDTGVGYFGWDLGPTARIIAGADYRNRFIYVQFGRIDEYEGLKRQVQLAVEQRSRPQ